ncbi:Methyltransferase domain-containing protein [Magnetospirillum fulvum]|uniref:Methyltransferase domain-containing protein n=2 Tax=Magnetospirillum fulvum TaxID=1082 RepID=A0A1H6IX67_MAGFU|nr:Methyltransferase domain-containing protein [Magnetospirillum fulvum]
MCEKWQKEWLSEAEGKDYGDLFFKRATGDTPEMESSKAASTRVDSLLRPNDTVVDVGCGAGHYLYSLRSRLKTPFLYRGVDATPYYIDRAKAAFKHDDHADFQIGNIFDLPLDNAVGDIVMCNNVLLHLPSLAKPLAELIRVSRRHVLIRTLVAEKSYVIQDVEPQPDGQDFDENNEPKGFHYLNIYGRSYITHLLSREKRVSSIKFEIDKDYDPNSVNDTGDLLKNSWDKTTTTMGIQVSGMIILPWTWIQIDLTA